MTAPTDSAVEVLVAGLTPLDCERLTGWQRPPGAAYNTISEYLTKMGLLNVDWGLSHLGLVVRAKLMEVDNG